MPETNDQVVQQAREAMREQILRCSQKAAEKIAARLKFGKKPSVTVLVELIAKEIEQLNP